MMCIQCFKIIQDSGRGGNVFKGTVRSLHCVPYELFSELVAKQVWTLLYVAMSDGL